MLGDIHGGASALRKALNWMSSEGVEAILSVGDFATLTSDVVKDLAIVKSLFEMLNEQGIPVLYVWGNRDIELFERMILLDSPSARRECIDMIHEMLGFSNLIEVPRDTRIRLADDLYITRNPELLDLKTIYLTHYDEYVRSCFLHIEGHVHYAQVASRYVNAGYVHRDDFHGARESDGLAIVIEISGGTRVLIKPLGSVKPMICPEHYAEGIFFVPSSWRMCPVCYDWTRAKMSRTALHL